MSAKYGFAIEGSSSPIILERLLWRLCTVNEGIYPVRVTSAITASAIFRLIRYFSKFPFITRETVVTEQPQFLAIVFSVIFFMGTNIVYFCTTFAQNKDYVDVVE